MSDTIDCPKCGHEHEPSHIDEDDIGEQTCDECGFAFWCDIEYKAVYSTWCKEEDHAYGPWSSMLYKGTMYKIRTCEYCDRHDARPDDSEL